MRRYGKDPGPEPGGRAGSGVAPVVLPGNRAPRAPAAKPTSRQGQTARKSGSPGAERR
jgi:hypothetical protein